MTLLSVITSRVASVAAPVVRAAVQRLGMGPVVLAVAAIAAAFLSWRYRPRARATRRRRLPPTTTTPTNTTTTTPTPMTTTTTTTNGNYGTATSDPNSTTTPWLSRVRRVTIGAICSASEPCNLFTIDTNENEKEGPIVHMVPDCADALRRMAARFELFLVVKVDDDDMQHAVSKAFESAGLFGSMDRRKVVFCETDTGRISVARQLESHLHIDECFDVILGLQRFVQCVAFVSADAAGFPKDAIGRNVVVYSSIASLFANSS